MWLIGTTYGTYDLTNKEIAPAEFSMHTKSFRYNKCTHFTVGTGNVSLNPG